MAVSLPSGQIMEKPFPFLNLPPEIRDVVYENLIQDGHLGILRVSKLISQEAISFMPKVAKHRVDLGSRTLNPCNIALINFARLHDQYVPAPHFIQNLDITLNIVRRTDGYVDQGIRYVNRGIIGLFSRDRVARRSCNITILYGIFGPLLRAPEDDDAYKLISNLVGFKNLTLKFEYRKDKDHEAEVMKSLDHRLLTVDRDVLRKKLLKVYKQVSEVLERRLGPAKLNDSLHGPYLSFKPRINRALSIVKLRIPGLQLL